LSLLESLQDFIRNEPGLPAGKIAKKLGVTRKDVNSLLYKHNKELFTRIDHGEKAPTWNIFNANMITKEVGNSKLPEKNSQNPGKIVMKKILEEIDLEIANNKKFETKTGSIRFEVVIVSEGMNSNFTRFEILDVDDLIIIINDDSYLSDFLSQTLENSMALHVLHCIADCLAQYKITRTKVVEEEFIPTKNEVFQKLLSMDLIKSGK
jgi:hypothetical protein